MIDVTREEFFDALTNLRLMESEDIAALSQRIDQLDRQHSKQLKRIETRLGGVESRLDGVETHMRRLETRTDRTNELLQAHITSPAVHRATNH